MLWQSGLETESKHEGSLQVVRIFIGKDGKLIIEFRTQAKFRGRFGSIYHNLKIILYSFS